MGSLASRVVVGVVEPVRVLGRYRGLAHGVKGGFPCWGLRQISVSHC